MRYTSVCQLAARADASAGQYRIRPPQLQSGVLVKNLPAIESSSAAIVRMPDAGQGLGIDSRWPVRVHPCFYGLLSD